MKINCLNFNLIKPQIKYPAFKGRALNFGCQKDTFEYRRTPEPKIVKTFNLEYPNGRKQKALIKKLPTAPFSRTKKYTIETQKEKIGTMSYTIGSEEIFIEALYTKNNDIKDKSYKGAGKELLKIAIEDSMENGLGGKISLDACHTPPPFVFYYKNNFMPDHSGPANYLLAGIHYAAANDIPITKLFPKGLDSLDMHLDEKGAEAFLRGERIFTDKKIIPIRDVKVKNKTIKFVYTEMSNSEFAIIALDMDKKTGALLSSLKGNFKEDKHGKKYIELSDFYSACEKEKSLKKASIKSAEIFAKEIGIKKVKKN